MLADSVLMYASGETRSAEQLAAEYRNRSKGQWEYRNESNSEAFARFAAILVIQSARHGVGVFSKRT